MPHEVQYDGARCQQLRLCRSHLEELGPSNRENAFGPRFAGPFGKSISPRSEAERLTKVQACDRQQPEQTVAAPRPQRVEGRPGSSVLSLKFM